MYNYYYRQNQNGIPIPTPTMPLTQPLTPTTTPQNQNATPTPTMPLTQPLTPTITAPQNQNATPMPTPTIPLTQPPTPTTTSQNQNATPMPTPTIPLTQPPTPTTTAPQNQNATSMPTMPLTTRPPYSQMQDIVSDIIELYHNEIMNMDMYQQLLKSSPNTEEEEIIQNIIDHTNNSILYLRQIYLGLTGDTINELSIPSRRSSNLSYFELLKNALFSKTDTLEQYESIYRLIPIQPYKDVLLEVIINQLKDATTINYLISIQQRM